MKRLSLLLVVLLLAGCGRTDDGRWLGYAEGDYIYVAAPQAGWITALRVRRGASVKPGDPLFTLDDASQLAARDAAAAAIAQAQGQMGQAQASLALAGKELARQQRLLGAGVTSKSAFDEAESAYRTALALVAQIRAGETQARAALASASYQLSQRDVVSQVAGRVQDLFFHQGEYAPAQTPVVSILPPGNVYVRFFVPENQFARVHLGERVKVECDQCAGDIVATVTFIADTEEYTPPVIFSNASRTQLVFKVEARAPGGLRLHPGEPVSVRPL